MCFQRRRLRWWVEPEPRWMLSPAVKGVPSRVYVPNSESNSVDVIDPATHKLLWRGQAVAAVDTDPNKFARELRKAVDAIVAKFPPRS